jgi:pimeloyl-ACP methyl ester carboxylesterase
VTRYLLIPGAWTGGWVYEQLAARLGSRGHEAFALTLPGLEPRPQPVAAPANLADHIDHVIGVLVRHDLRRVTLCGHGYGGLVISGVADREPTRIARLVYLDAYVGGDGDSCWSLTNDHFRGLFAAGAALDGRTVTVPAGLDSRARPHPLASLMQGLRLRQDRNLIPRRTLVHNDGWLRSPFGAQYERLRNDPQWDVHRITGGEHLLAEQPDALAGLLDGGVRL